MNPGELDPNRGHISDNQKDIQLENIIVFYNTESSQAELALKHIEELKHSRFGNILQDPIETHEDRYLDEVKLRELLREEDRPTAIISLGGDGTANRFINPLLSDNIYGLPISFLAIACGDANDLPIMTNGKVKHQSITEILEEAKTVEVNPIDVSFMSPEGDEYSTSAFSYVGIGNTALLSYKLNHKDYRETIKGKGKTKRLVEEGKIVLPQMRKHNLEKFVLRDSSGERTVNEKTFVNGSRMAKFGRFDGLITDSTIKMISYEKGNFIRSINWMGRLALGRLPVEYIYEGEYYDCLIKSDTFIHADAEVRILPQNTFVKVQQNKRSISVISTHL